MSHASGSISGRIFRTAQSLMPQTLFTAAYMLVAFVLSMSSFFWTGFSFLPVMFAMGCALGLGHMTCLYQKSERRRLVPGMNETCAATAIAFTVALWLFNVVLIVAVCDPIPEAIGGTFLLIVFCLWIGWGERRIFYVFGFAFLALFVVIAIPNGPTLIYEFYKDLSLVSRNLVGVAVGVAAVALLWRFWVLSTSKIGPVSFKQQDRIFAFVAPYSPDRDELLEDSSDKPAVIPWRLSTRIHWLTLGRYYSKKHHYFWGVVVLVMLISLLWGMRGDIEATSVFSCIVTLILAVVIPASFLTRVPQAFGRLWVTGVSDSRSGTAGHLMKLALWRMITVFTLSFLLLLLQVPVSWDWCLTLLTVLLCGVVFAGILLWPVARWYVFFSNNRTFALIALVLFALAAFFILIPSSVTLIPGLHDSLGQFGRLPGLLVVLTVAAIIWIGCIHDCAKSLGESTRLLECESGTPNPVSSFDMELY